MNILRKSAKLEAVFLNRAFQTRKDSIMFWVILWEALCSCVWIIIRETSGGRGSDWHNKDWQSYLHVPLWSQFMVLVVLKMLYTSSLQGFTELAWAVWNSAFPFHGKCQSFTVYFHSQYEQNHKYKNFPAHLEKCCFKTPYIYIYICTQTTLLLNEIVTSKLILGSFYLCISSLSPDITVLVVQDMAHLFTLYPVRIWSR